MIVALRSSQWTIPDIVVCVTENLLLFIVKQNKGFRVPGKYSGSRILDPGSALGVLGHMAYQMILGSQARAHFRRPGSRVLLYHFWVPGLGSRLGVPRSGPCFRVQSLRYAEFTLEFLIEILGFVNIIIFFNHPDLIWTPFFS